MKIFNLSVYFAFITFVFILFSCSNDGNPLSPTNNERVIYGKVINGQGNPLDSVKVHYIPALIDTGLSKINFINPNATTIIKFSIPEQSLVTIVLLTHSLRDTVFYILKDELLQAGNHSVVVNTDSITNGVYDYVIKFREITIEKSLLILKSEDELVNSIPLTTTDSEGKFTLDYNSLAIGYGFDVTSEVSPDIVGYKIISDTIKLVLIRENYNIYKETIVIDINRTTIKNFTLVH